MTIDLTILEGMTVASPSKIIMLVIDGLGGLPNRETGKTELEAAFTPHLDAIASSAACGLIDPIGPGITPGSGPAHLALFGYDPLKFSIGRGVLEALGVGFELLENDIAARGNFCTVDENGILVDRRAGRITTDKCAELCSLLSQIRLPSVELFVEPVREHRFMLVLRGEGLSPDLNDTDPQKTGMLPYKVSPQSPAGAFTANLINSFIEEAKKILRDHYPSNMILLRGFSRLPDIPPMTKVYKLKPAGIAKYPMYKGLAKLVGMEVYSVNGGFEDTLGIMVEYYSQYDFFYIHVKEADSAGEDGDFERKVTVIEQIDKALPKLLALQPDVLVITGDHSTPALLRGHSWHPVPILIFSPWCRQRGVKGFSESLCASGELGRISALDVMPLAMAHALKLNKFGA